MVLGQQQTHWGLHIYSCFYKIAWAILGLFWPDIIFQKIDEILKNLTVFWELGSQCGPKHRIGWISNISGAGDVAPNKTPPKAAPTGSPGNQAMNDTAKISRHRSVLAQGVAEDPPEAATIQDMHQVGTDTVKLTSHGTFI